MAPVLWITKRKALWPRCHTLIFVRPFARSAAPLVVKTNSVHRGSSSRILIPASRSLLKTSVSGLTKDCRSSGLVRNGGMVQEDTHLTIVATLVSKRVLDLRHIAC